VLCYQNPSVSKTYPRCVGSLCSKFTKVPYLGSIETMMVDGRDGSRLMIVA